MNKIRILLVDDHAVLRAGLRALLGNTSDIEVVGEADNGLEAIKKTRELAPDVVLLDISMPGLGGLEAIQQIKRELPSTKILVLTMYDDESYLDQVLRSGGSGYVLKKAADTELLSAIYAVSRGEVFLYPSLTRVLVDRMLATDQRARGTSQVDHEAESLSPREREVLRLVARGYTNRQMADALFLSVKTVETYKARLMAKLELRSRADLVRYAMKKGLLTPSEEG